MFFTETIWKFLEVTDQAKFLNHAPQSPLPSAKNRTVFHKPSIGLKAAWRFGQLMAGQICLSTWPI